MADLTGQVAIVTGGARGMGVEHARRLIADGARVLIGDVQDELGEEVAASLGEHALFTHLDITSEDSWNAAVQRARSAFGPVNALVNNAGVEHSGPLHETTVEELDRVISVNFKGAFLGIKAVVPDMIEGGAGAIVNIGAGGSLIGYENMAAYQSSKSALLALTKTAAIEYGKHGIRINALHPGITRTPMLEEAMAANAALKQTLDDSVRHQPIPRLAETSEIASVVSFLLGPDASFVTGVDLLVDGGLVLGKATPLS